MARPTYPLRFTHDWLRELVRAVAEQEGISQNELLEQAAEHEVVARGALLADELEASAAKLRNMTGSVATETVVASMIAFAEAEALPDPIRPRRITRDTPRRATGGPEIGAVAAFKRG